ncbi:signal peptidase I [Bacillus cereus]|uniref:signal peptidase I n=1 Tax=Bacillus cereus group TaxID=86661 RepID=UPI0030144576
MFIKRFTKNFPYILFSIALILVSLRFFMFFPNSIAGNSMYPTLKDNDRTLINKQAYKIGSIHHNDIVAINLKAKNKHLVKRVIGLPGDKIEYINSKLFINNQLKSDNFSSSTDDFTLNDLYGIDRIPEGKVFVLGDNRKYSNDSRSPEIGFIPISDITGKIQIRFSPLDNFTLF